MTNILLATLIVVVIVNMILSLRRKINFDISPQLKDLENQVTKFDILLEKTNKDIKEDFKTNRLEINDLGKKNRDEQSSTLNSFKEAQSKTINSFKEEFKSNTKDLGELLEKNFNNFSTSQQELNKNTTENIKTIKDLLQNRFTEFNKQNIDANKDSELRLKEVKESIEKHLKDLREDNSKQLEAMRQTVDEKLQKTLNDRLSQSFEVVGKQLQAVQAGLGEMKNIATDVGGLKKVLSNVKMRGGIGEVQLSMLLEQILAPDQYDANVKTNKNSNDNVEFAVKLPGKDDIGSSVLLPIDAKFPKDIYEKLQDAYDDGDPDKVSIAQKNLDSTIKKMAKDIGDKYLNPPFTTDFGIMFLPFEGIYAEVVRKAALLEELQVKYKVIVTGPTTLAAILNSLQMGFKTLAIQKKSSEVWQVLSGVKTEFGKFEGLMLKAQKNIQTGLNQLDDVMGTRTRAIQRKLKDVGTLEVEGSSTPLEETIIEKL